MSLSDLFLEGQKWAFFWMWWMPDTGECWGGLMHFSLESSVTTGNSLRAGRRCHHEMSHLPRFHLPNHSHIKPGFGSQSHRTHPLRCSLQRVADYPEVKMGDVTKNLLGKKEKVRCQRPLQPYSPESPSSGLAHFWEVPRQFNSTARTEPQLHSNESITRLLRGSSLALHGKNKPQIIKQRFLKYEWRKNTILNIIPETAKKLPVSLKPLIWMGRAFQHKTPKARRWGGMIWEE